MPRSPGQERQSVPPPGQDDRTTEKRLVPSTMHPSMAAESTRDVAQEDFLFHLYRGSELLQEARVLEAKEELEFALTMQPSDPKGQDLLGAVYFRLGLYPRAIQIYEELSRGFPNDASIKINLALCYLKTGQPEEARKTLQDATRISPDHKRAWGYLGLALQKLGELDQAQIAFERGGHILMARRTSERRQRVTVPAPADGGQGIDAGVRSVADAAFSELDAGELKFALAEPAPSRPSIDGPWHAVEPGAAMRAMAPTQMRTQPPAPPEPSSVHESATVPPAKTSPLSATLPPAHVPPMLLDVPPIPVSAPTPSVSTRLVPPPPEEPPAASSARVPVAGQPYALPPLLAGTGDGPHGVPGFGARVEATDERPFAAKLEALRVVVGAAATRVLHRRVRDADTSEVLGGIGSPMVRVAGGAQLVVAPRAGRVIVPLSLAGELAFVREELLLGFELRLAYENGRMALEAAGDTQRLPAQAEGTSTVVQLRGTGTALLELGGPLATVPCAPGRSLLVRREWVVGWLGRLVPRALAPGEAPSGQRGLIAFAGEGTVLVSSSPP